MEFRRKLYTRGSSYETTIPMPILFSLNKKKKHEVIFVFEPETNRWFIKVEEEKTETKQVSDQALKQPKTETKQEKEK